MPGSEEHLCGAAGRYGRYSWCQHCHREVRLQQAYCSALAGRRQAHQDARWDLLDSFETPYLRPLTVVITSATSQNKHESTTRLPVCQEAIQRICWGIWIVSGEGLLGTNDRASAWIATTMTACGGPITRCAPPAGKPVNMPVGAFGMGSRLKSASARDRSIPWGTAYRSVLQSKSVRCEPYGAMGRSTAYRSGWVRRGRPPQCAIVSHRRVKGRDPAPADREGGPAPPRDSPRACTAPQAPRAPVPDAGTVPR